MFESSSCLAKLDIKVVDIPTQLAQYLHRVGRIARANKTVCRYINENACLKHNQPRSVTLVGEAAIKHSSEDQVRHGIVPTEILHIFE